MLDTLVWLKGNSLNVQENRNHVFTSTKQLLSHLWELRAGDGRNAPLGGWKGWALAAKWESEPEPEEE